MQESDADDEDEEEVVPKSKSTPKATRFGLLPDYTDYHNELATSDLEFHDEVDE